MCRSMAGFDVQHLGNSLAKAAVASAHASRLAMRLHPDDEAVQQALQEHAKGAAERTKLIEEALTATNLHTPDPTWTLR